MSAAPPTDYQIRLANLEQPQDAQAVLMLLDHYAQHPLGNSGPLPAHVRDQVIHGLRQHPTTHVFLAETASQAVGMAICFLGFSTFQARPLINIHDLVVHESFRAAGIGGKLIDAVIELAANNAWCAVTLEVRADNRARELYARKGFQGLSPAWNEHTTLFGKLAVTSHGRSK